ncbi:endonuclease [Flavobacterium sp.]|jgi:endonuclease I|uniref:endonuclease n=1 Tax=Flavobacterium sp. TaxID=239 RepID=UPI0037BFF5C3
MKKIISILLLSISAFAQNGAPATPYYNGFNWNQTGTALKNALATKITNTHTNQLSYSDVWDALKIVDLDPTNSANVLLVYGYENGSDGNITNDRTRSKNSNGGAVGDWNREHVFAQSLGNPELGQTGPGADAQMLRASDVQRNGERGNKFFAEGSGNSATIGANWYPGDEWKGDVARIMFYMYLRYENRCTPNYNATGTPIASDSSLPAILLQWNAEDPVSQYEDVRNTYLGNSSNTFGQGNRNPFIDNPYLATLIWGGPVAQNRWPNIYLSNEQFDWTSDIAVFPNPTNNNRILITTQSNIDVIELVSVNGQLIKKIENPISNDNAYSLENLPKGFYLLKISSENKSVVKKVIVD